MRLPTLLPTRATFCVVLTCLTARVSAYFMITEPTQTTVWKNGVANPIKWTKGVLDGIDSFDVEMTRLSTDGLSLIAKDVSSVGNSLNVLFNGLTPADDYFLLFVNSTHGIMYATSPRFTIIDASSSPPSNATVLSPDSSAATVTLSGPPNPTLAFATTFPPVANGVISQWSFLGTRREGLNQMWGLGSVMIGCVVGAAWTLW